MTYTTPIEHHNPMEPHATIALWDGDRMTVYTRHKGSSALQHTLSQLFGLKPEQVRVICPFVGGGFGCKGVTWPHVALDRNGSTSGWRPVKLSLNRAQMYTSNGYRPQTIQRFRIGAGQEGRLIALTHDGLTQMSVPALANLPSRWR